MGPHVAPFVEKSETALLFDTPTEIGENVAVKKEWIGYGEVS